MHKQDTKWQKQIDKVLRSRFRSLSENSRRYFMNLHEYPFDDKYERMSVGTKNYQTQDGWESRHPELIPF